MLTKKVVEQTLVDVSEATIVVVHRLNIGKAGAKQFLTQGQVVFGDAIKSALWCIRRDAKPVCDIAWHIVFETPFQPAMHYRNTAILAEKYFEQPVND